MGQALTSGEFTREETVSTKTLYHYVEHGLLRVKTTDLPERLSRKTKDKRCASTNGSTVLVNSLLPLTSAASFAGHKTTDDNVLLTLYDCIMRKFMIIPIMDKTATRVMAAFKTLHSHYLEHWNEVFKTITTDNGSEFADLAQLEEILQTLVYYAHPYTSCYKGGVEQHNRF